MMPFLVFDLETQRSADEVGGWGYIKNMLYSVAVVWDSEKNSFNSIFSHTMKISLRVFLNILPAVLP